MPAVRDVGARFIAPACRHTVRWAMYTNFDPSHGRRAFRLVPRGRGEKYGLLVDCGLLKNLRCSEVAASVA